MIRRTIRRTRGRIVRGKEDKKEIYGGPTAVVNGISTDLIGIKLEEGLKVEELAGILKMKDSSHKAIERHNPEPLTTGPASNPEITSSTHEKAEKKTISVHKKQQEENKTLLPVEKSSDFQTTGATSISSHPEQSPGQATAIGTVSTGVKDLQEKIGISQPIEESATAALQAVSEWSHQQSVPQDESQKDEKDDDDDEWQVMPAFAPYDIYDDDGKLIAREHVDSDDDGEAATGGAGKGYTRLQVDEDAQSATSMDENTQYLFKDGEMDDELQQNPLAQLETTKDLLTEGQRVAYVGLCRLGMVEMMKELQSLESKKTSAQKSLMIAVEHMRMWSQIIMVRLYKHMEITPAGSYIL